MLELKLFNSCCFFSSSFSNELANPPGGCFSVSEEKALKTELVQVTSTNSPLNPFSKIPHEREMSLAKKSV